MLQLFNRPGSRFDLKNIYTQYPQYSKRDLDMRRKAEILKYSSNQMSSQTNSMTNNQKWAAIATKNYRSASLYTTQLSSIDCSMSQLKSTPTSACDVPGPIIYLYDDEKVPLYNYANQNSSRAYGIITPT